MANIAICSFYSGVVERGVETFAYEVSKRLIKKHQITIFQAGSTHFWKKAQTKTSHLKVKEIKAFAQPPKSRKGFLGKLYLDLPSFKILLFSLRILPYFLKGKFDLVIPLNGGWQTLIFRIFSKFTQTKLLISGHAGIGSDDAANLLLRPDVFVALTQAQADWVQKLTPEVKTVVIPNGVDLFRFNPKIKPKDLPLEKPIVICASALVSYKRVDSTIKAVARAKNLSLLVLGDGEMRGFIDILGKRLLGRRYLRLVVPYEQIPSYYRAAKVFTLASKTEAFGISYVEAMACNLPVVTTNDSSRQEIVGDAGILTDPSNIDLYAKDLSIASQINYKNIPYTQALKFSWNKVAQKYSSLIETMIAAK